MNLLKTGLFLTAVGLSLTTVAKELSPAEALNRLKDGHGPMLSPAKAAKLNPVPVHTARTLSGEAAVYVFATSQGNDGYLVLSADDQALPILGYSDSGTLSADNIPPQMEWWLSEYAAQIEYARQNNISSADKAPSMSAAREAIAPMLKTKWDQVAPYNDQCPLDGTQRTWTGCVATSIAQVMKYYEYPKKGQGQITYSIESLEKKVTMNFGQKEFDWDNMLDTYIEGKYNEEQASAVAYLMKACGYAVKMQYSLDASGALALNIRNGLVKYFDYDPNTLYTLRAYYSTDQWNNMIYENLKNVGPVVYGGGSVLGGGHSFVCDGYDGQGLFHFNWGWSGISDGYFTLEALNPGSLGTGGGTGGGYNFTQDALLGLKPNDGQPAVEQKPFITQEGELTGTIITDTTLRLSITNTSNPAWVNYNPSTLYFKFGVMFEPQGDTPGEAIYQELPGDAAMLEPGYGVKLGTTSSSIDLTKVNLSDGTYKVVAGSTVVSRTQTTPTDGSDWVPVKPYYGMPNYVTLTVKDGKYSVTDHLLPKLIIKGEFTSPLYYGCLVKVKVTVENPADIDRVSGFAPIIANQDGVLLMGESLFVDIPAHSVVTREWVTEMAQFVQYFDPYINVPLVFSFFNEDRYNFYLDEFQEEVKVLATPTVPKVNVTNFSIAGAELQDDTYIISDPNDIQVSANLSILIGYFAYPVVACLCQPASDNQMEILESGSAPIMLTSGSRKATFQTSICYPSADPDKTYYIVMAYSGASGLVQMSGVVPVKFAGASGIPSIEAESEITFTTDAASHSVTVNAPSAIASVEAYDITGRRADSSVAVSGTTATVKLSAPGLSIIHVRDNAGHNKVFKVVM